MTSQPDLLALEYSNQLTAKIKQEIQRDGAISFARFMELALYAPGLGYYVAGASKLGSNGDFTTAPEISSLYSKCIARQCQQVLAMTKGDILEFGAGTGKMAVDILLELERLACLPEHYYIVEVSADLRARQQSLLSEHIPHLKHKFVWLNSLEMSPFNGVILANEVLDAFPVHRFKYDTTLKEYFINEHLEFVLKEPTTSLQHYLQSFSFSSDYESEVNLFIPGWIQSLSNILGTGLVLLIDYGFTHKEYYHPDRNRGTLMCHYRHQAHTNPLINIGLQDITAHVDFTAVAEAALAANLLVSGFTNQASFLMSCGIIDYMTALSYDDYFKAANKVKILTSPNEMGELFKVMALSKELELPLLGFSFRDMRDRL